MEEMLRWGFLASRAANLVWDYDRCLEIGTRAVQARPRLGALEVLAAADNACGQAAAFGGDFASAALLIAEVDAVKEATGTRIGPYAAIALAGHPRPGGRGLRADRRRHHGQPPPAARGPPSSTRTGRTPFS